MRVLITGTSGLIGGAVARHLTGLGWDIVGVDNRPPPPSGLKESLQADISLPSFTETVVSGARPCSAIVHAAAALDHNLFAPSIALTNCFGTQQLLALADAWKVESFIFFSSVPVIGRPKQLPVTEEHPVDPPTAYHASKIYGEHLVNIFNRKKEIGAIFRLTSPVGPGMPTGRILSVFIRHALAGEEIPVRGKGTRRQNYVDARDVAAAVRQCLEKKCTGTFNIAAAASISNHELARTCKRVLNSSAPVVFTGQQDPEDGVDWDVSIQKAAEAFGYRPGITLEESIKSIGTANASGITQ